jgi:hypothetical protein
MDEVFTLTYNCDHQEVFVMSTDDIRQILRYVLKNPYYNYKVIVVEYGNRNSIDYEAWMKERYGE